MQKVDIEEALKKRYPEAVALVACQDNKKVNVTPIGWFTLCNSQPRCWAIALYHKHYSHKVISETKEFTLCLPSYSQKDDVLYCGSVHGWDTDKLENCHFKTLPAKSITPPILADSIAAFECKVIGSLNAPDHTIFIGEILHSYISGRTGKIYNRGERNLFSWEISKQQSNHNLKI